MQDNAELRTFNPYCNLATIGLSEMKAKSFLFTVNGRGMMRPMKTAISNTKRQKTYNHVVSICWLDTLSDGPGVRGSGAAGCRLQQSRVPCHCDEG